MEPKQIKDLMAAMSRTGIRRLAIKRDGFELELERESYGEVSGPFLDFSEENPMRSDIEQHRSFGRRSEKQEIVHSKGLVESNDDFITSPMVGTFYTTPSPDDPAFIKIGERVEPETIVCIIEAMKVMNEVKAGVKGTVVEILVDNGQPIEFGTKLFRVTAD